MKFLSAIIFVGVLATTFVIGAPTTKDPMQTLEILKMMVNSAMQADSLREAKLELIELSNVNKSKCSDPKQLSKFDSLINLVKNNPDTLAYLEYFRAKQMELCNSS